MEIRNEAHDLDCYRCLFDNAKPWHACDLLVVSLPPLFLVTQQLILIFQHTEFNIELSISQYLP